jgi:hypothetical protein
VEALLLKYGYALLFLGVMVMSRHARWLLVASRSRWASAS